MQTRQMESSKNKDTNNESQDHHCGASIQPIETAKNPRPLILILGDPEQDARGLGWLSIGFGLAEVMAPHSLARFLEPKGWHCIGSRGLQRV